MSYCTLDDIRKRLSDDLLIQLTDDDNLGVVDQRVVDSIIAGVGELIDGHLRGRYALPLASVPGIITVIAVDICLYELHGRRPMFSIPESIEKKYTAQMKILKEIKAGGIELGIGGAATPAAEAASDQTLVSAGEPLFSPELLSRY